MPKKIKKNKSETRMTASVLKTGYKHIEGQQPPPPPPPHVSRGLRHTSTPHPPSATVVFVFPSV